MQGKSLRAGVSRNMVLPPWLCLKKWGPPFQKPLLLGPYLPIKGFSMDGALVGAGSHYGPQ